MTTKVEICNLALLNIGVRPITSLTELSEAARRCALAYDPAVDGVLREHEWNFAIRIEALALISGETVPGFDYLYIYPSNCLNPLKLCTEEEAAPNPPEKFRVLQSPVGNQKAIATNLEFAWLEYVARIADETMFDASFVEALSFKLAAMLAQPLTKNANLAKDMSNIFMQFISKAKAINKNEGQHNAEPTSSYINARG